MRSRTDLKRSFHEDRLRSSETTARPVVTTRTPLRRSPLTNSNGRFLSASNGRFLSAASTKPTRLHFDVPLLLITITLLVFGMLMVYSASADFSYEVNGDATAIFKRQLSFLGVGLLAVTVMFIVNYHAWQKLALFAMGATIVALVAVLFTGDVRFGAIRALYNGSVQPSELAKVVTVLYLTVWLYAKRDKLHDISFGLIPLGMILGFLGGLIYLQPDLSAALTIFLIGGILFFLAGGDLKQIFIVLILALLVGALVVTSGGLTGTGNERINSFLAGWVDPLKASYHVQRSLEAFVKGGFFGVGIGNADTKFTGLPVPHTDSIFAVVGEETGLLGSTILVVLYSLLLWRGLVIAQRAPDALGRLLASGLSIWLAMEAYINMAVMVGLMPFAGNALPFISVGGSNLVMSLVSVGIILNISRLSEQSAEVEEKTFSEVVDLRWWDRRRRVSSSRRSPRPDVSTTNR